MTALNPAARPEGIGNLGHASSQSPIAIKLHARLGKGMQATATSFAEESAVPLTKDQLPREVSQRPCRRSALHARIHAVQTLPSPGRARPGHTRPTGRLRFVDHTTGPCAVLSGAEQALRPRYKPPSY